MNGSAIFLLGAGAVGIAIYLMTQPKAAADNTAAEPDTATPAKTPASHGSLDVSQQVKTGIGPMSASDIAGLAFDAGFMGQDLVNIVAVAFAESGGDPDALNSNGTVAPREGTGTDTFSAGLWQINLKAHPNYQSVNLFDPIVNSQAAYDIFRSQGLKAWGGYTSGNYARYLNDAQAAVNA